MLRSAFTLTLLWGMLSYVLLSAGEGGRLRRLLAIVLAFAAGTGGALLLLATAAGDMPFAVVRMLNAALLPGVMAIAGSAALIAAERDVRYAGRRARLVIWVEYVAPWLFSMLAGALTIMTLAGNPFAWRQGIVTAVMAIVTAYIVASVVSFGLTMSSRRLPFTVPSLFLLCASLLFCMAASSPRLDLFAPLSMKVMKFTHDFVHQFLESMLLPDHLFINRRVWELIGFLFSKEVGFWGGLILWFAPAALVSIAIVRTPLPAVAHIRQGAQRRSMIAAALRERRTKLVVPFLAAIVLTYAVYRSLFPAIQYWDPAPIAVEAGSSGEIEIPLKQGELSLRDGKIHKFSYARGRDKVRFFVLDRGDALVVALDACAICLPDGYGQGEGTVICYYCKTLIPLDTVGRVGGCNPVPVPSIANGDVVRISAMQLVNLWNSTVQATTQNSGGKR